MEFHKDGNLIYSLTFAGWRRGEELLKNRVAISFTFDSSVPEQEREDIMRAVLDRLNGVN